MIKPVSLVQNNVYFGIKRLEGGDYKTKKPKPELSNTQKTVDKGFYTGMMLSAILGAVAANIYKDNQINNMLQDIAKETVYDEFDCLKIEDMTEDKVPDIVLIDKNGDKTVYDITSGQVYIEEQGELIEKY